jgi:hypothetical protein
VRVAENRAVINLDQLWDGLLRGGQSYRNTGNIAIELRKQAEFAHEKLAELSDTAAATSPTARPRSTGAAGRNSFVTDLFPGL